MTGHKERVRLASRSLLRLVCLSCLRGRQVSVRSAASAELGRAVSSAANSQTENEHDRRTRKSCECTVGAPCKGAHSICVGAFQCPMPCSKGNSNGRCGAFRLRHG